VNTHSILSKTKFGTGSFCGTSCCSSIVFFNLIQPFSKGIASKRFRGTLIACNQRLCKVNIYI
jgi:hypothetical protein